MYNTHYKCSHNLPLIVVINPKQVDFKNANSNSNPNAMKNDSVMVFLKPLGGLWPKEGT